jgi:hypothetical protein
MDTHGARSNCLELVALRFLPTWIPRVTPLSYPGAPWMDGNRRPACRVGRRGPPGKSSALSTISPDAYVAARRQRVLSPLLRHAQRPGPGGSCSFRICVCTPCLPLHLAYVLVPSVCMVLISVHSSQLRWESPFRCGGRVLKKPAHDALYYICGSVFFISHVFVALSHVVLGPPSYHLWIIFMAYIFWFPSSWWNWKLIKCAQTRANIYRF